MRNLRLWWEAGGGRWADADLETALAIADLGTAIDRKVKTYSQGMRQRLGLARVLLGKPEILVLDEPTNGLDPGEMREVRQLVRRVAESGSTVLFSSHVLAEVEQICTPRGRDGQGQARRDRLGRATSSAPSGTVYLEVDDVAAARRVLDGAPVGAAGRRRAARARGVDGRRPPRPTSSPRSSRPASRSRRSPPRRRLEDAFLGLVEGM